MKILITGATGFIGAAVIKLAASRGHEVAALVRPGKNLPSARPLIGALADAPWDEIAAFQPEVCIHTAWITTPGIYLESPENFSYVDWSLDFAQRLAGLGTKHFIALGTCIEYAASNQPLSEDHSLLAPVSVYARCKESLRQSLEKESALRGFGQCWARVFYPYGPGEHPERLCSTAIRNIRAGQKMFLKNPDCLKDYIFIDDLASALMTVAEKKFTGTINLGTGNGVTVRHIVTDIAEMLGRPELIECANPPKPYPSGEIIADARRLHTLGWQPKVLLPEGIRRLACSLS